jgi:hypothetical protein
VTATEVRPTVVGTWLSDSMWYSAQRSTTKNMLPSGTGVTSLVVAEARGGKKGGSPRRAGSQQFSKKKTERGPSEAALSVMKCTWDGGVIRIRKEVTRFRGGWEPVEAGARLERDFICDGCLQCSAAYGMNNFSSNRRKCNVLGNPVGMCWSHCAVLQS